MTTPEFLSHLRDMDVRIFADGDRLNIDAPKDVLTPSLRAELAERKEQILAFLREADETAQSNSLSPQPDSARREPAPFLCARAVVVPEPVGTQQSCIQPAMRFSIDGFLEPRSVKTGPPVLGRPARIATPPICYCGR